MFNKEIKEYLEYKAAIGQLRAANRYRIHLERFDSFAKKDILEVRMKDIADFIESMRVRYAETTIVYAMAILKNFLGYLRRCDVRCVDPALLKLPRVSARSYDALSIDDYLKVEALTSDDTFMNLGKKVIVRMLYDTGMRLSELCSLNISQIDSRKNWTVIETRKNKKPRTVVWSEKTHRYLLRYLGIRICENQLPALFIASKRGGRRERISHRTVERWVKELAIQAGVSDRISPHSFRHGWAHLRRDRGASLPFISEGLGHSSIQSTMIYQQYNNKEFRKEAVKHFV